MAVTEPTERVVEVAIAVLDRFDAIERGRLIWLFGVRVLREMP